MGKWIYEDANPPFRNDRREMTLDDLLEAEEKIALYKEKIKKEAKEKADKEKMKKGEPIRFSFLETFTLFFLSGFVVGPMIATYVWLDVMVRFIEKAKILAPLLK